MRENVKLGSWNGQSLEWLVVDGDDTSITLWCKQTVARMPFHKNFCEYYSESIIRPFLEGEFYENAFSTEEKAKILETAVDCSEKQTYYGTVSTGSLRYRCDPITAKVYLPSVREIMKTYALTNEEIYRADTERFWTRSPNGRQSVSLINCSKEILNGKSPYTYDTECYNPIRDDFVTLTTPYFADTNKEHSIIPVIRIKR